jgi:N-acetyltransferase
MEWGREEEKDKEKAEVNEVAVGVRLKDGKRGRILCVRADATGKIGSKVCYIRSWLYYSTKGVIFVQLATLFETINLSLSSPALEPSILRESKAYLFLLPQNISSREKIVGCVIAQRIKTAMSIASADSSPDTPLISVDTSTGLYCHPAPLPTYLGIPRLFVSSSHRRRGIATHLLTAAAATFLHGCPLDPAKGEIAFTQPTGDGRALMNAWGKGGVRIYDEGVK